MVSTKKVLLHVLDAGNGYIASKLPLTSVGKVKRFLLKEMAVLKELGLSTYEKMEPVFHDLA